MAREAFVVETATHHALRALNYARAVEQLRRPKPNRKATSMSLRTAVRELGVAYATVFARVDAAPDCGVELLSQSDMFAAEPSGRWIRRDSMSKPERYEIRPWQILVAGAGTLGENELYGRSIIADNRLVGRYVGQDTLVLGFDPPGSDINLYTYAFLSSPTGVKALRSTSYGTKILRLRKDMVGDLPIPLPDQSVVASVAACIRETASQRERYAACLAAARRVVEELPEMQAAWGECAVSRARVLAWDGALPTLSAWTYASTGAALSTLSRKWSGRLADALTADGLFNGPRFARIPVAPGYGIEFMSQRDAFLIKPVPRRIAHPGFDDRKLFVPRGSVLVGGHGTLGEGEIFGRCVYVTDRLQRAAFTQDLLRIQPIEGLSSAVFAFLSTHVGFRLLRSCAVGTKILSLRPDLLRALPLPELSRAQATRISKCVDDASEAREAADRAEAEAVRIIEEEVLPQWLA